jgi:hypothetical protein
MPEEDQLDRVTQALAAIRPTELGHPESLRASDEDRAVIERFEAAVKRLESFTGRPI